MKRDATGRPIQGARGESGLTAKQELNMIAKALRYPTSAEGRLKSVNFIEQVIAGEKPCEVGDQIKAVEVQLKMEAMNMMDERAEVEAIGVGSGERIVYLLPENGSERVKDSETGGFEGDGDVVLSEHNWAEASVEAERESYETTELEGQ